MLQSPTGTRCKSRSANRAIPPAGRAFAGFRHGKESVLGSSPPSRGPLSTPSGGRTQAAPPGVGSGPPGRRGRAAGARHVASAEPGAAIGASRGAGAFRGPPGASAGPGPLLPFDVGAAVVVGFRPDAPGAPSR